MDNIIKLILEMDKKAQKITNEAEDSKTQTLQSIPKRKKEIRDKYLMRARLRIQKNSEQERKNSEEKWKLIKKQHDNILNDMEKVVDKNYDLWVKEIVSRTIGRDDIVL